MTIHTDSTLGKLLSILQFSYCSLGILGYFVLCFPSLGCFFLAAVQSPGMTGDRSSNLKPGVCQALAGSPFPGFSGARNRRWCLLAGPPCFPQLTGHTSPLAASDVPSSPTRTPKLQLTAEQPSTGECWIPQKKRCPVSKDKGEAIARQGGGAKSRLESNPTPAVDAWRIQTNLGHTRSQHRD